MPVVKTSAKGQVVIPADLREKAGIKPGDKVFVTLSVEGKVILEPLPDDPVEAAHGVLRTGSSLTKALLKERRKDIAREEAKAPRFLRSPRVSGKRTRVATR
ncbi:MAG: AbrB/MazE/SpoVT family DNA-binding domain-containing protein [Planctomycetes bacterium]|nr:AbrB/MazE/SpoVT family DNA-binding domain-containing protein [Planctomycetota bacterium]